jgi:hypothetical protein
MPAASDTSPERETGADSLPVKGDTGTEENRISLRITPNTREVIDRIKLQFGYRTDADVIRHALGTQLRIGESVIRGERIYVGDTEGRLLKELVFVTPTG